MSSRLFNVRLVTLVGIFIAIKCEDGYGQYNRVARARTEYVVSGSAAPNTAFSSVRIAAEQLDTQVEESDDVGAAKIPEVTKSVSRSDAGITKVAGMFDRFVTFDPNVDVLWPGCIVLGSDFAKGFLAPTGWSLKPMTVTVTGLIDTEPGRSWSFPMDRPSLAQFTAGIQKIVESKGAKAAEFTTTARISFDRVNFDSLSQALMRLGIHANYLGASVRSSLQTEDYHRRSNVAVSLTQNYYTASVEYPGSPSRFLIDGEVERVSKLLQQRQAPSEDAPEKKTGKTSGEKTGEKKPRDKTPAYVASVTFGRKLILIASSSEDQTKLSLAVEAAASFMTGSAGASLTVEQLESLKNADLRIIVLGGPSPAFMTLLQKDQDKALKEFLEAGISFWGHSGGLPLSYVLRSMKDGKVIRMAMAAEFSEPNVNTANLDDMTIHFHTTTQDKDNGTGVGVKIYADKTLIGQSDSCAGISEPWENSSDHDVTMMALKTPKVPKSAIYTMIIKLSGDAKTWKFVASGSGKFGGQPWSFPPIGEFLMGEGEAHEITLTLPNPK